MLSLQAEVFLFPSLFEGCGMPNLESMACECPVVTSATFAIPEIVGDGAMVVSDYTSPRSLYDAMEEVISSSTVRNRLVKKGLDVVKKYSWKVSAQVVLESYSQLLDLDQ